MAARKGIGSHSVQRTSGVLELSDLSGQDLNSELAESRIMDAVQKHVRDDLGAMNEDVRVAFGLKFNLDIEF
jgi:hypothetical protein